MNCVSVPNATIDNEVFVARTENYSIYTTSVDVAEKFGKRHANVIRDIRDLINNDRIWSKFLTVGEGGLLQYTVGNETNGGKGALQVLDELNKMSGEEQIKYMSSIGYSYTDTDGNKLEGTELVTKFFEELQK